VADLRAAPWLFYMLITIRHILKTNGVEVLHVSENVNGDTTDDLL